jgi:hypothetical protein
MKKTLLITGFCIFLLAGTISGCTDQDVANDEVQQIVDNVLTINSEVDTCRFEMSIMENINIDHIKGQGNENAPESMMLTGDGEGLLDIENQALFMKLNTRIEIPGEPDQDYLVETYFVGGYVYTSVPQAEGGEEWIKIAMPSGLWDRQNQLIQQAELLENSAAVKYLGEESIDGQECYVVELKPSTESLKKLLSQIDVPMIDSQAGSSLDLPGLFKDLIIKQWINKESYLFIKTVEHMSMELEPQDIGVSEGTFKKLNIFADIEMKFYDYNQPVNIQLPAGAEKAREIAE